MWAPSLPVLKYSESSGRRDTKSLAKHHGDSFQEEEGRGGHLSTKPTALPILWDETVCGGASFPARTGFSLRTGLLSQNQASLSAAEPEHGRTCNQLLVCSLVGSGEAAEGCRACSPWHPGLCSPGELCHRLQGAGFAHWPQGPKHTGASGEGLEGWVGSLGGEVPTRRRGFVTLGGAPVQKRGSGSQAQPQCISVPTFCLQVCPPPTPHLPPPNAWDPPRPGQGPELGG